MAFDVEYEAFLQFHRSHSKGERLRRLQEENNHAERAFAKQIWWPLFHQFDGLHPEYPIRDFRDGQRFLDYAYIEGAVRLAIEVDGFGPHWRDVSRWQFADDLQRQNYLLMDGWHLLRFAYDEVLHHPRQCQQTIQHFMGHVLRVGGAGALSELKSANEREIVRLARITESPLTVNRVCELLKVGDDTARKLLKRLASHKWLQPARGTVRISAYVLHPSKARVKF